eukprot:6813242-Karenia_brevis.AAC.1
MECRASEIRGVSIHTTYKWEVMKYMKVYVPACHADGYFWPGSMQDECNAIRCDVMMKYGHCKTHRHQSGYGQICVTLIDQQY